MGLLWWRKKDKSSSETETKPATNSQLPDMKFESAPGMHGAVEVPRPLPTDVTVFEFGSVATSTDKVTVAGFCPVSDDLEPCHWEILPAEDSNAAQFRVVF